MRNFLLYEPRILYKEISNVNECLKSGWLSPAGNFVKSFEKKLSKLTKSRVVLTNSGTSALHLSLILANVKRNDEVLVPTITFVATVNSVLYLKANPVFIDCEKDNPNLDLNKLIFFLKNKTYSKKNLLYNKKTKKKISAIILTHVFGNPINLEKIKTICKKNNIKIIEDAAEALGAYNENKIHAGTVGDYGILSFNINKILTTGGGGALILKNKKEEERARILISQGKKDNLFFFYKEMGFNYGLSNINAAIGCAQMKYFHKILKKKKKIYEIYKKAFAGLRNVEMLKPNNHSKSNYWLNSIVIKNDSYILLKKIIRKINSQDIQVRPVWYPCHKQKFLKSFQKTDLTNANRIYSRIISMPSSYFLNKKDIIKISTTIKNVINKEIK